MPDEVKEELVLRDAEDLVGNLDEEAEPLSGDEVESLDDRLAEVPGSGAGLHQGGLETVVCKGRRMREDFFTSSVSSGK